MVKGKIGIDTIKFEVKMDGIGKKHGADKLELISPTGIPFGVVSLKDNSAELAICLPRYLRANNVQPFTGDDMQYIDQLRKDVLGTLGVYGIEVCACKLKSLESNITQSVNDSSNVTDVLNLIRRSCDKVIIYESASTTKRCEREIETAEVPSKNYYRIKAYNKFLEQRGSLDEDKMLRIEIVMLDRTCKRLFGDKTTIKDILHRDALQKVFGEYKRIFVQEFKPQIENYLRNSCNILFEGLMETDSPLCTLTRYRDIIVDDEVFRRALKRSYWKRGKEDHSRQIIHGLKEYELPKGAIKTISEFHLSCS